MVFRVMLEETLNYLKQQKDAYRKWKDAGYKLDGNEFLSKIRKQEKYVPVINREQLTLSIYFIIANTEIPNIYIN